MQEEKLEEQPQDVDDGADDFIFTPEERERQRLARRPNVEHLDVATSGPKYDRTALFDVGQRIVVERMTDLLGDVRWLDTKVYQVKLIDRESGLVKAIEEEHDHWALLNFKSDKQVFRLAPKWPANPFHDRKRRRKNKKLQEFHDRTRGEK